MRYYRLDIKTDNSVKTYNKVTQILGWAPYQPDHSEKADTRYAVWSYMVDETDKEPYFDFINVFLDKLEPSFEKLNELGIKKEDITIWLLYEYEQQCGLEFKPTDMKRLGDNDITLCVDCWQTSVE